MKAFLHNDKTLKRKAIAWQVDGGARKYFLQNGIPLQIGTRLELPSFDKRYKITVVGLGNLGEKGPMWRKYVIAQTAGSREQIKLDITHFNAAGFSAIQPLVKPLKGPAMAPGQSQLPGALSLAGLTPQRGDPAPIVLQ